MLGWFKKKPPPSNRPDFSAIDSVASAEQAIRRGELEKLFMFPLEFGGARIPQNTLYVPTWVPALKAGFDHNVIRPLAAAGLNIQYSVIPQYQRGSVVPIAITTVWAKPGDAESSTYVIKIWGGAPSNESAALKTQ